MNRILGCALFLLLTSCGSGSGSGSGAVNSTVLADQTAVTFVAGVNHPYFPLEPGLVRTYQGFDGGERFREEAHTLLETRIIDGVECTGVEQRIFEGDEITEITTEWYAEDAAGNVWKFGEETLEEDGGTFEVASGSWTAGVDGAERWLIFPVDPRPGDAYFSANESDGHRVLSVNQTVSVPAGTFDGCIELAEAPGAQEEDDEEGEDDGDIILYARGVGRVQEINNTGVIELRSVSVR